MKVVWIVKESFLLLNIPKRPGWSVLFNYFLKMFFLMPFKFQTKNLFFPREKNADISAK